MSRGVGSRDNLSEEELREEIISRLTYINYYRLSGYAYPFRKRELTQDGIKVYDEFKNGTTWEKIWDLYLLDRRLRNLLFDAVSRIEIALRTQIAYQWSKNSKQISCPQAYTNLYRDGFCREKTRKNGSKYTDRGELLKMVNEYYAKSSAPSAVHHKMDLGYTEAEQLPVWVFCEFTTFGNMATLLSKGLRKSVVEQITQQFGLDSTQFFISVIHLLQLVRNDCAHQGRIWNNRWISNSKDFSKAEPILKDPNQEQWGYHWNSDTQQWEKEGAGETLFADKTRTAAVLTVCQALLKTIAPKSHWKQRLFTILDDARAEFPKIETEIGFTSPGWRSHPLWK